MREAPDRASTGIEPDCPVAVTFLGHCRRETAWAAAIGFIVLSALIALSLSAKAQTDPSQVGHAHFGSAPVPTPKPHRENPTLRAGWIGLALTTEAGDWLGIVERIELRPVGGTQPEVMVRQADWTLLGIELSRVAEAGDHLIFLDQEPE